MAARLLTAARREVGRAALTAPEAPSLSAERLADAVEADPETHADLERARLGRLRSDPWEAGDPADGARAERRGRLDAARRAIDGLVLAGELVHDGPGRLRLPGFGPATWRAVTLLREDGADAWARALVAEPAADLAAAAPDFLTGLARDPERNGLVQRMHAWEARRQDARDALLRALAAEATARERGLDDAARTIRADCDALEAEIRRCDDAIAAIWTAGSGESAGPPG